MVYIDLPRIIMMITKNVFKIDHALLYRPYRSEMRKPPSNQNLQIAAEKQLRWIAIVKGNIVFSN